MLDPYHIRSIWLNTFNNYWQLRHLPSVRVMLRQLLAYLRK